jgi:hypothetical protein
MITSNSPYFDYLDQYYPSLCADRADAARTLPSRKPRNRRLRRWALLATRAIVATATTGGLFYLAFPGVLA